MRSVLNARIVFCVTPKNECVIYIGWSHTYMLYMLKQIHMQKHIHTDMHKYVCTYKLALYVRSSARVTNGFLVTSLTKAFSPDCCLARRPALGRALVVPNFFHLWIMEATVLLGTFNAAEFFVAFPRSVPRPQSCLWALQAVPSTSWLGFCSDMHCQLWDLIYRQMCAFPNHVQSIEFTTGGLQSRCRNISKMIKRNGRHLS